jgi:hypothetical protein
VKLLQDSQAVPENAVRVFLTGAVDSGGKIMPKTFKFVCEENENFGMNGWRQADKPHFDPLMGLTVAHDILEHFPNGTESPADEFQALGAAYFIRGETGYMQRNGNINPPAKHIASDFPDIFQHIIHENMSLPYAPKTRKIDLDYVENFIAATLQEAEKLLKEEFGDWDDFIERALELLPRVADWIRIGYRRAARRYSRWQDNAVEIFDQISEKADKALKRAEIGDKLIVSFSLKMGEAKIRHVPAYEEEYA